MRMMRTRQPTQQPSTLTSSMVSWRVHKLALWAFLLVLAVHCPRTATAQDTPSAGATPTSTPPGAVPPANTTDQEIQLMPTLPLQTTTANLTRDQASSASSNQQQQQQQPAASPIQTGELIRSRVFECCQYVAATVSTKTMRMHGVSCYLGPYCSYISCCIHTLPTDIDMSWTLPPFWHPMVLSPRRDCTRIL